MIVKTINIFQGSSGSSFQLLPLVVAALLLAIAMPLNSQVNNKVYKANKHYTKMSKAQRVADPSRPEVIEFFWYGCLHCLSFEKPFTEWKEKHQDVVNVILMPAVWQPNMVPHAQAYYTAEALGQLERLHKALFVEIARKRRSMESVREIKGFFAKHGVSEQDFDRAWNSFGVRHAVKKAEKAGPRYGLKATPTVVVNGKYQIYPKEGVSMREVMSIANSLIRSDLKAKLQHKADGKTATDKKSAPRS